MKPCISPRRARRFFAHPFADWSTVSVVCGYYLLFFSGAARSLLSDAWIPLFVGLAKLAWTGFSRLEIGPSGLAVICNEITGFRRVRSDSIAGLAIATVRGRRRAVVQLPDGREIFLELGRYREPAAIEAALREMASGRGARCVVAPESAAL